MAHTADIDDLLDHVNALERRAVALAREGDAERDAGWSRVAAHRAAHVTRAATRRFPLLALAAAFGLGLYVASRFES
jgi:hypothetical protein